MTRLLLALLLLAGAAQGQIQPQDCPDRPIRVIVATAAGGASDILARSIRQKLSEAWGQPVVVDPRPGANGNVAALVAAHPVPDDHTLMMGTIGVLALNPAIYRDVGYDPARDFDPMARLVSFASILAVNPRLRWAQSTRAAAIHAA